MRVRAGWITVVLLAFAAGTARGDDREGVLVEDPDPGTPEHLVQQAFFAAQMDDFRMFYGDLCHRDTCALTDVAMEAFRSGPWALFRARYEQCLEDRDVLSFRYQKRIPRDVKPSTRDVTFVFGAGDGGGRIVLKRDKEGEWRVFKLCE